MSATINMDAIFEEHRSVFYGIVKDFANKYNEPFDDVLDQAGELFTTTVLSFDNSRGLTITQWIRWKLPRRILDRFRSIWSGKKILPTRNIIEEEDFEERTAREFDVAALCRELSKDASIVIEMIVARPKANPERLEGAVISRHLRECRRIDPKKVRGIIRASLADLGWTKRRINATISELVEVFS